MRIVLPSLLEAPARAALSRFLALIRAPGSGPERRIPRSDPDRGERRTLPHPASRLPHHPRCNLSQEPAVALALAGRALISLSPDGPLWRTPVPAAITRDRKSALPRRVPVGGSNGTTGHQN